MPLYIMLTTLTQEGRGTIKHNPERIREVNREVEKMGVKVLAQYATLGPYDFLNILEAPDNRVITRVALELGARGTVHTMTMPAQTTDEFIATMSEGLP